MKKVSGKKKGNVGGIEVGDLVRTTQLVDRDGATFKLFAVPMMESSTYWRTQTGRFSEGMIGLVVALNESGDVRVSCVDGVGWIWEGNIEKFDFDDN